MQIVYKPEQKYIEGAEDIYKFEMDIRSFQQKSNICPFKWYTYKKSMENETGFTVSQPRGYYRFVDNL